MKERKFNQKGSILIEAIIALTVIVVLMTALVSALVASLSSSNFSKNQTIATGYAQDGLEKFRALRDQDYDAFRNFPTGYYCLGLGVEPPGTYNSNLCSVNIDSIFSRTIYINRNGWDDRSAPGEQKCDDFSSVYVVSILRWTDSKCDGGALCHRVELDGCFSNLDGN